MKMEQPFALSKHESETELWMKLKAHIEKRMDVLRRQNDGDMSAEETSRLRGKIAFAKEILGLESGSKSS